VILAELAIRRPITTVMALVSLVVLGSVALMRLPLAFMPEFVEPELFIAVSYPSASPEQVERMIVRPLEDAVGSVRGLKEMWSSCNDEGGNVRLGFDAGTDLYLARAEIWDRIDRMRQDLPEDVGDIVVSRSWSGEEDEMPILDGRLASKRDLSESYDLLERKIIRPLERVPGVASVRLDGVNPREVRINLRVADLETHGVDVRDVARLLRSGNFDMSLGDITTGENRFTVRSVGSFTTVEEVAALPLRGDGLRLSDVADVVYAEPPLEYGRHLDGDFAVGVTVTQESRANTVAVCKELQARIAAMNDDPELEGVSFITWFDQGHEIEQTLRDLAFTGVFGSVLAALVLFAFLRRFSTTFVAVLCIPFSLIVTCGVIWARGGNMNTLTLLGLIVGVGMLVDNAVVVMENISRHREEGKGGAEASLIGSREVAIAVTAATLTSVIVFLPLIFNKPSQMNVYLRELGVTVCIALLASLFISQTLIPMAMSRIIHSAPRPKTRAMVGLEARHERTLGFFLRHRWLAPVVGLAALASTVFPYSKVDKNFGAEDAELFVQVQVRFSEELPLKTKESYITRIEQAIEPHRQELKARAVYAFWSDRWSMLRVYLEEGESTAENLARARAQLRAIVPDFPGVTCRIEDNEQGWRHGGAKSIGFSLVGEDTAVLNRLAEEAVVRLGAIPGLMDAGTREQDAAQEMHVEVDRALAVRYGVDPTQVGQAVGLTFRGRRLQRFRTPDGEREMRLTLDEQENESIAQLRNLPLYTTKGDKVPLASVATFTPTPSPERIERDNRKTSVWVGARYRDGTVEDYRDLVVQAINGIDFPYGYSWTFGRWEEMRQEQSREFTTNLLLALLLVFVVMAALFESIPQAIALLVSLPFAIAGAFWTLWATGTDFDQPAAIGLLLLIGIVVNNGIVMLEHINQYRRTGMPRHAAMLRGGRERLRPIMMTAITTLIGLVPIVVQKPSLAGVYYYSMALVIMGGLAISTFLTAVLLPATATLAEDGVNVGVRSLAWVMRLPRRRAARAAPVD
jgi:hydrophobic/amphiphilic exporter-1 (mainly G- bacteria), HAE1 family